MGKAINKLHDNGIIINERLINITKTIYKYACNDGIRHGGINLVIASENDAIYILVLCAACINYLNYLYKQALEKEAQ